MDKPTKNKKINNILLINTTIINNKINKINKINKKFLDKLPRIERNSCVNHKTKHYL